MTAPRPDRRQVLRWGGAAGLGLSLSSLSCFGSRRPPNVLLVSIDDLNNWVGCLGMRPDAKTPRIDGLAASGRLFTRAYSPATTCNASRSAVLSGLRPNTTGIFDNKSHTIDPADASLLPGVFQRNGYRALGGGKVFHLMLPQPWDEYFAPVWPEEKVNEQRASRDDGYGLPYPGLTNWGPIRMADSKTWDGQLANWAVRQLERDHSQPFFMAVGFFEPHLPWHVPRKYFRPFPPAKIKLPELRRNDLDDVPRFARIRTMKSTFLRILQHGQWQHAVSSYLAAMYYVDTMLGRVLDALAASPYRDDTIVVLWSDHGYHHGQKWHWQKYLLWEQATQVPFIVSAPGMAARGEPCDRPVDLMHIYPTLLDLCGIEPAAEPVLAGRSLRPLLEDPGAPWDLPAITTAGYASHAVRNERWRYIHYDDGSEELYDEENDPNEWYNVASRDGFEKIKAELRRWMPATPAADPATDSFEEEAAADPPVAADGARSGRSKP